MTANDIYAHRVVILSSKYCLKGQKRLGADKNIKQIQLVQSLMIYYKIIIWLVIRRGMFRSVIRLDSSSIYDNDSLIVSFAVHLLALITWSSATVHYCGKMWNLPCFSFLRLICKTFLQVLQQPYNYRLLSKEAIWIT